MSTDPETPADRAATSHAPAAGRAPSADPSAAPGAAAMRRPRLVRALALTGLAVTALFAPGPAGTSPSPAAPAAAVELTTALPLPAAGSLPADAQALLAAEHGTWRWPVAPAPRVVEDFDPPAERWQSGHRGVDLTVGLSGEVRAPEDGRVSHVGTVVDRATITIDHGDGLRSSFEPVASDLKKGDRVRKGQVIGVVSEGTHCLAAVRACVHWGVRLGDDYVHPLPFVGAQRPSVLLPVPE
ncbi:M23 family metallopeptidase [Kocuria palustris]|uniref:M23 family metallopeptidase n=1 Tax=Kocuria palustris TaxID=71999 RepID=UPI0028CB63AA|nr:M23 family metallopeptidase [Kocuria palustris]